jgi:uncharacterized protein YjbI with pentapeptide repeats/energy-coupling factor transporter ATP-binding protein EcfA2
MERYALVIGIGQYDGMDDLSKPGGDAIAFQQVLKNAGWRVTCLNNRVTYDALEKALKTFLERQAAGQDALIYFTGHGFMVEESRNEQRGYLATSNCEIDIEEEKIVSQRRAFSFSDLNGLIGEARLSSLVVLLDCCHGGLFVEDGLVKQSFQANPDQNFCWIAACRSFQQAYARTSEPHSLFTGALLKSLAEGRAENGEVTVLSVFRYIDAAFKRLALQEPIYIGAGRDIPLICYKQAVAATVSGVNPYQGLDAFTAATKQFFFGRDSVVDDLVIKVQQCGFVPLIGASGSGKSSVARAGLIPRLEDLGWRILKPMTPGTDPVRTLQELLDRELPPEDYYVLPEPVEDAKILLVVDQFEELFALCRDKKERSQFIQNLLNLWVGHLRLNVVVTMRADFVEACLADKGLTQAIRSDAVWLGPMTGADLEAAIEQPAIVQGATMQPKLLAQILQDVATEENCLPLLEFALFELWVGKAESELTLASYRKLGGMAGALNDHANGIYKQLAVQKREHWVKRVMLRLVRTGEGPEDTRQRQRKSDLLDMGKDVGEKDAIESVIKTLVDGRLLASYRVDVNGQVIRDGRDVIDGQDVIDLSHETLMRYWQKLANWLKTDRDDRQIVDKLEDAYKKWRKEKKRQNLLEGRLLKDGKRLLKDAPADVVGTKEFIQKSLWWRRSQFASAMTIPLLVLGVPAEYFWREESVKRDYDRIERLSDGDKGERAAVLNLAGGCWAVKSYEKVPVYLGERMFGNCRSLQNAKLEKADLTDANLSGANLSDADLNEAKLIMVDLSNASLLSANLIGADLERADLRNSRFWKANLRGTSLHTANLHGADFTFANLVKANLSYARLVNVSFRSADLNGAAFWFADLSGSNFSHANLIGAVLTSTNLSGVDFGGADLSTARIESRNMSGSNFSYANLSGAVLESTNLSGAVLSNIRWSDQTKWPGTKGWENVENIPLVLKQQLGLNIKKVIGVGIQLATTDEKAKKLTVISLIEGSPASQAGVLAKDIIIKINDQSTEGIDVEKAATLIRGELGTSVKLTIQRGVEIIDYNLKRDRIVDE